MVIAVDFDGTIVEDRYPAIGDLRPGAVEVLKRLRKEGYLLILWTCRTGKELAQAVKFCAEAGIRFDAINENLRYRVNEFGGSDPRKVSVDLYIDDRGLTELPSWQEIYRIVHRRAPDHQDMIDLEWGFYFGGD
ncbi:MAG TPA: hydrolase [Porphyromonadaceae bacterium]|nr:hydrolase [Porphyromonadaceae bacterium]